MGKLYHLWFVPVACGLVSSNTVPAEYVTVYDIDDSKFDKFNALHINTTSTLSDVVEQAEIIFLAVKPAIVKTIMKQLSDYDNLLNRVVIVSFAAAVSIEHIIEHAKQNVAVIRTMPSTPILVGEGVIAVAHNEFVDPRDFQFFCLTTLLFVEVFSLDAELHFCAL